MGIIPALAGNIIMQNVSRDHARDHPRACGEHPPCGTLKGLEMVTDF